MGNLGLADWTIIGFSGHRELTDPETAYTGIRASLDRVAALHGPLVAVSSTAIGADTFFLEEVARRDIPSIVLLPFHRTRFRQDFSSADWERVEPLLDRALTVEELDGTDTAEEAYMETGIRAVERADLMVVFWDGKPARGDGGTAEVVDYARDVEKPMIIIDPLTGHLTEERLDQLPGKAQSAVWDGIPRQAVERQFELLDQDAVRHRPWARMSIIFIIVLHLVAAGVGGWAFFASESWAKALIGAEIVCLVGAGSLVLLHRRIHDTWVQSRISAELCRSFLAMWHLRGRTRSLPQVRGLALDGLYRSLSMAWYLDRPVGQDLGEARDQYLRQRVQEQLDYFRSNLEKARLKSIWMTGIANLATGLAILLAIVALVLSFLGQTGLLDPIKMFVIMLPLASAAVLSQVVAQDHARRKIRYAEMVSILEGAVRKLRTTRTWQSLARIAVETEEELLREVAEWHTVTRFAGQAH